MDTSLCHYAIKVGTTEIPTNKNLHCCSLLWIISYQISHQINVVIWNHQFLTHPLHLHASDVHLCFLPMWAFRCLYACPYAVASAVTKETSWGGEEVPKGVRHGEERHVVHSLSLEEGLSEIHRLIQSPSSVHHMGAGSFRCNSKADSFTEEISSRRGTQCCFLQSSRGSAFSLFPFPNTKRNSKQQV